MKKRKKKLSKIYSWSTVLTLIGTVAPFSFSDANMDCLSCITTHFLAGCLIITCCTLLGSSLLMWSQTPVDSFSAAYDILVIFMYICIYMHQLFWCKHGLSVLYDCPFSCLLHGTLFALFWLDQVDVVPDIFSLILDAHRLLITYVLVYWNHHIHLLVFLTLHVLGLLFCVWVDIV